MATLLDELKMVVHDARQRGISPEVIRTKLKETLQFYVIDFIYNSDKYQHLVFYGGTCLRVCFGLNRMSEDIDFETTSPFDKNQFARDIEQHFRRKIQYNDIHATSPGKKLERVELKLPLLYELGLSSHIDSNLIVKVEVHLTRGKYPTEIKTVSQNQFSFILRHYDLPTLMAGKMLACLDRVWEKRGIVVKGRDYYDLLWYMQKGIIPNRDRLADTAAAYTIGTAFARIREKVLLIKPDHLITDLEILFENADFPKRWVSTFAEEFENLYRHYQNLL